MDIDATFMHWIGGRADRFGVSDLDCLFPLGGAFLCPSTFDVTNHHLMQFTNQSDCGPGEQAHKAGVCQRP